MGATARERPADGRDGAGSFQAAIVSTSRADAMRQTRRPNSTMAAIGISRPSRRRGDQQRTELRIVAAPDHEDLVEILGLQLACDQRHVHQRCHESEPGRPVAGGRVEGDQGQERNHADLRKRGGCRGIDHGDGAGAESERRFRPMMEAVEQPDIGERQHRTRHREPEQDCGRRNIRSAAC